MACSPDSIFTFVSSSSNRQVVQEAIKVHNWRERRRHKNSGHRLRQGNGSSRALGEEFHIWDTEKDNNTHSQSVPDRNWNITTPSNTNLHFSITNESAISPQPEQLVPTVGALQHNSTVPLLIQSPQDILIGYYVASCGESSMVDGFLRICQMSAASFHAFLFFIATRFQSEQGVISPIKPEELENQALHAVMEKITWSPNAPGYGTILAVAILTTVQEYRGDRNLAGFHWNGLKQMVDLKGGVEGLRMHEELHSLLYWQELLLCNGFFSPLGQRSLSPRRCFLQHELATFMYQINVNLPVATNSAGVHSDRITGPIKTILQRPCFRLDDYNYTKWYRAKLSCLTFLAAFTVRNGLEPSNYRILDAITLEVLKKDDSYTMYPEELLFIIIDLSNHDHLCEVTWLVSRLMCALKQLYEGDIDIVLRLLKAYLGFEDPIQAAIIAFDESQDLVSRLSQT